MLLSFFLLACADSEECAIPDEDSLGTLTEWEQAWRDDSAASPLPDPAQLLLPDGLPLVYRDWVPAGWDGSGEVLLFIPGSSAHSGLYGPLGESLAERGIYTRIIDVRGHGLSVCGPDGCGAPEAVDRAPADDGQTWVGRVGDSADEQQLVRDVGLVLADLSAQFPAADLNLGGHSSGGGLVSRTVETTGAPTVDRVVLLAPYNHPDQPQVRDEVKLDCFDTAGTAYARVSLGALGDALRGNVHRYVLRFHKSETYTDDLDTLAYSWNTMVGMAATGPAAFWGAYHQPVLLVAGSEDHLLDPDVSAGQVGLASDGTFALVEDTSHIGVIWSDEVAQIIADWLAP